MAIIAFAKDMKSLHCLLRRISALYGLFEVCSQRAIRKRPALRLVRRGGQRVTHRSPAQTVALRIFVPNTRDELAHLPLGPPVISCLA